MVISFDLLDPWTVLKLLLLHLNIFLLLNNHFTIFYLFIFNVYSVNVVEDGISIFDTGPGMDGSDENSIVKWYVIAVFLY